MRRSVAGEEGGFSFSARPAPRPGPEAVPDSLARRAYRAYRRTQAVGLLRLVPRETVRALYSAARDWAVERGVHDGKDPMDTLLRYCEELLPLPPYRDWLRDTADHPAAHLRELDRRPGADPADDFVPMEVCTFERGGTTWFATLNLYRDGRAWRGFVAFHRGPDSSVHRTADIFREESPERILSRFRTLDPAALRAFLRSVLP